MRNKKTTLCDRIIFIGIVFLLIFAPLAFGSVHVWAYSLIDIGVFILVFLWFIDRLVLRKASEIQWVKTPVNLLLILMLFVIGFQLIPLPAGLVKWMSPQLYEDKMQLHDVLSQSIHHINISSGWMTLAYYEHPVMVEGLKVFAYMGMFFLVLNTVRSKQQIDALIYILLFTGLFVALYGIYQVFGNTPRVWWWRGRAGGGRYASGTFIGSNHFAFYLEMSISLVIGFIVAQQKRTTQIVSGLKGFRSSFQRFISKLSPESVQPRIVLFVFIAMILVVALLMSASRGGILSIGMATLITALIFLTKKHLRLFGIVIVGICIFSFLYGINLGIDTTLNKFENTQSLTRRLYTTRSMFPMVSDYPLIGNGWGNFRYLYPRYVPADYDGVYTSGYSHNDWLEAVTETGILGGSFIVAIFLIFLFRLFRVWRRRNDFHALGIGAGVMLALLSTGFHSIFDFSMHIPANPLMLAALMGIGYLSVHRQGRGPSESFFYRTRIIRLTPVKRAVGMLSVMIVFGVVVNNIGRHFLAEAYAPTEWNSTLNLDWNPDLSKIDRAISLNPDNAEYYWKRAWYLKGIVWEEVKGWKAGMLGSGEAERLEGGEAGTLEGEEAGRLEGGKAEGEKGRRGDAVSGANSRGPVSASRFRRDYAGQAEGRSIPEEFFNAEDAEAFRRIKHEAVIESLEQAVRLNPARETYWYELGLFYSMRNYDPYDFVKKWLPLAENCFDACLKCAPKNEDMHYYIGRYWVWRASILSETAKKMQSIGRFQEYFKRSLALNQRNWRRIADHVWEYFPDDAVILGVVPDDDEKMKSRILKYITKK